jgi:hypothetical protein
MSSEPLPDFDEFAEKITGITAECYRRGITNQKAFELCTQFCYKYVEEQNISDKSYLDKLLEIVRLSFFAYNRILLFKNEIPSGKNNRNF